MIFQEFLIRCFYYYFFFIKLGQAKVKIQSKIARLPKNTKCVGDTNLWHLHSYTIKKARINFSLRGRSIGSKPHKSDIKPGLGTHSCYCHRFKGREMCWWSSLFYFYYYLKVSLIGSYFAKFEGYSLFWYFSLYLTVFI